MKFIVGATLALLATPAAAAFDVAVEAPAGYSVQVSLKAGDSEATAKQVYNHHEAITNRFQDRWYVVNVNDLQLQNIGQVCAVATRRAKQVASLCSPWNEPDFVPGNRQAVLLKLDLPEVPPSTPFDVAVEAADGLEMVFILGTDDETVIFNNVEDPIRNRWEDRYYVVNVRDASLDEVSIICVTHRLPEPKFICVRQGEYKFLPGYDGQVVHIVYPDPR